MNRHRFRSDMEAAWELRPMTDETPGSAAHHDRFRKAPVPQMENQAKDGKQKPEALSKQNQLR